MVEESAPRQKLPRTGDYAIARAARERQKRLALEKIVRENEEKQTRDPKVGQNTYKQITTEKRSHVTDIADLLWRAI